MTAAVGSLGALGIDTVSPVTARFDFRSEALVMDEGMINANGTRGTRSQDISRIRSGLQRITGPINMQPNAVEMANLLGWITGGTPTGSPTVTYPLADTLPSRYVTIDRRTKVFTYTTVKVDRATFRCAQGEPLEVDLSLVAVSESVGNSGTFPVLSINTANGPFVLSDLVINIGASNGVTLKNFEVTIDNKLDKDRFFNATTLASIETLDREVMFTGGNIPYGDWSALYGASSNTGLNVVATFTNGGAVLTMTMSKVVLPRKSPHIDGRREILLPLSGQCYANGATAELVITQNPGP